MRLAGRATNERPVLGFEWSRKTASEVMGAIAEPATGREGAGAHDGVITSERN